MTAPDPVPAAAAARKHRSDADALPLLLDTMRAAGYHDADSCLSLLSQVETLLGARRHKAKPDVHKAKERAVAGDFPAVWRYCWAATTGLTWAFPPDPGTCPPVPGATPFGSGCADTCRCGATPPPSARFCPACGTAVPRPDRATPPETP
ncbi:hypothetical protein ASF47_18440 [Nocardioides sp. Leaf285]|nr:hypothetical protein ASF47_18440 [Nocardioides sp. Leaf285]